MSKKIRLIWTNGPFVVIEICNLLDDNDLKDIYYVVDDVVVESIENIIKNGMVMFEDDMGVFSLYAGQIVSIEPV